MQEFTLRVPGQFAEDFRSGIVGEIAFDTQHIQWAEIKERDADRLEPVSDALAGLRARERREAMAQLIRDARLAEQVGLPGDTDEIEITTSDRNELDTLASVCEAMDDKVVEPRLARALGVSPIDHEQAGELRDDLACLGWAIDHAAELNQVLAEALKLKAVAS